MVHTMLLHFTFYSSDLFSAPNVHLFFVGWDATFVVTKKVKSDNSDEDHHNQVNYFIITVALKIFFSCNKNRLKAVDANYATLQNCTKNHWPI